MDELKAETVAAIQAALTFIAAAIAIIPALVRMRADKKKVEAEGTGTLTDSAMRMIQAWETRTVALEQRVNLLEHELDYWQRGCYRLINQLVAAGITPCWQPNGGPLQEADNDRTSHRPQN